MIEILKREFIYLWYYADVQFRQIFGYWVVGMVIGSFISVFAKDMIHSAVSNTKSEKWGIFGIIPSCILGVISPLCMYGTVPLAASFAKKGMREDYIASFMMASILLNPQLIIYSMALGNAMVLIRIISCTLCGIVAGLLIYIFYMRRDKKFLTFQNLMNRYKIEILIKIYF